MRKDLIFDVGMHNGDDTAFYLSQGFHVVAIEADPTLAAAGAERFKEAVERGTLRILNVGIATEDGEAEFWICDGRSEWNSFNRHIASREGHAHHSIKIPTKRFGSIIKELGVPQYVKIDIEGNDGLCISDLSRGALPQFVSTEDDGKEMERINVLRDLGYCRFKLIDQASFSPLLLRPTAACRLDRFARRMMALESAFKPIALHRQWRSLWRRFTYRHALEKKFQRAFPIGCSGSWGEDTPGQWMTYAEAQSARAMWREKRGADTRELAFWCDWHASL